MNGYTETRTNMQRFNDAMELHVTRNPVAEYAYLDDVLCKDSQLIIALTQYLRLNEGTETC